MAANGWFPDPGGAPGQFRYWDGDAWSQETTADPKRTPPPKTDDAPSSQKGNKTWLIALGVLVVITAVVVALVLHGTGGFGGNFHPATEDTDSSTPTVSAWDETSTPTRTPPPTTTDVGGDIVTCPTSSGYANTPQVAGYLTADTLIVATIKTWVVDSLPMYLEPVYDTHSQTDQVYPGWMSNIAVGLMANADGFVDIATTAEQLLECFASSGYYYDFTNREDVIPGEQISVSGYAAWHIQSNIYVSGQQVPGDLVDIIVVDLGPGKDHLGVFYSSCSIGDDARCALVHQAMATLAVKG